MNKLKEIIDKLDDDVSNEIYKHINFIELHLNDKPIIREIKDFINKELEIHAIYRYSSMVNLQDFKLKHYFSFTYRHHNKSISTLHTFIFYEGNNNPIRCGNFEYLNQIWKVNQRKKKLNLF
jgi:hypothetical protein